MWLLLIACTNPRCHAPCEKLFGDGPGECNLQVPGYEGATGREAILAECLDHCDAALETPGDVGDYSPNERSSANEEVALENREQARAWIDCVEEVSCDYLQEGYCAPTVSFP
ncbi:MAG: hypothetical protein ACOZNI_01280 [Myxococcota bacterium]